MAKKPMPFPPKAPAAKTAKGAKPMAPPPFGKKAAAPMPAMKKGGMVKGKC